MNAIKKHYEIRLHIRYLLLLLLFSLGKQGLYAQYQEDYHAIRAEGRIPNDFLNLVRGQSRINIQNSERLNKAERENFRDATNFALRSIFTDGNIYFNDPLTDYVRIVAQQMFRGTHWGHHLQFYVSKNDEMNASSWQTGTIIINVGLLSKLENEAQLAYVLAHEAAHFRMQHPYKQYAETIRRKEITQSSELVKNFREHFDFSMKYELEADSLALVFMKKAGYDVKESLETLRILVEHNERLSVNWAEYFSSDEFQLEESHLCDFKSYSAFKNNAFHFASQHFSNEHIKERKENLENIIEQQYTSIYEKRNLQGKSQYVVSAKLMENTVNIARFEVVEQAAQGANYLKSTYEALVMLRDFPQNAYLHAKVAENLYQIGHYSDLGLLDRIFFDSQRIEEDEYAQFCCLFNNTANADLQQLIHGFIKKIYRDFPKNETALITVAKSVEKVEGKDASQAFYQLYVKIFPRGKHYIEAKQKLK